MLGDVPTNNRTVEIQMMNRFLRDSHLVNISFPEGIDDHESIKKCYENLFDEKVERGTLNELKLVDVAQTAFLASRKFDPVDKPCWIGVRNLVFPRSFESHILTKDLHQHLKNFYRYLYPNEYEDFVIPYSAWKTNEMYRDGKDMFAGENSRSYKSSFIMAHWSEKDGTIASFNSMPTKPTPGQIKYFLKHTIFIGNESKTHVIAFVSWFLEHSDLQNYYGKPVEVWHHTLRQSTGSASFIPVKRIASKFVHVRTEINGQNVIVVLPRKKCIGY